MPHLLIQASLCMCACRSWRLASSRRRSKPSVVPALTVEVTVEVAVAVAVAARVVAVTALTVETGVCYFVCSRLMCRGSTTKAVVEAVTRVCSLGRRAVLAHKIMNSCCNPSN